jgi:hypothetical protein
VRATQQAAPPTRAGPNRNRAGPNRHRGFNAGRAPSAALTRGLCVRPRRGMSRAWPPAPTNQGRDPARRA